MQTKPVEKILSRGGIAVIPTDTIYGVVAPALEPSAVARLYKVKGRTPQKPFIVLIGAREQLELFGIKQDQALAKQLKQHWPGPVSIILPCDRGDLSYLHRGSQSLALRLPGPAWLRRLALTVGPLVAPSANPEGKPPAETIVAAKNYFGGKVDYYLDGGRLKGKPSRLLRIGPGKVEVLRP